MQGYCKYVTLAVMIWCLDVNNLMFVLFYIIVNERLSIKDHYEPLLERRRQEIAALAD